MSAGRDALDNDRLTELLSIRMPDRPGVRVERTRRSPGGMSRETWFADIAWDGPAAGTQRLTVRMDHELGSVTGTPLRLEFDVLRGLYGTAVPVAEPLWFEDDPSWLGRPFYVRDCVAGEASPKPLYAPGADARRHTLGRRLVELLADLHTLDWAARGMGSFMAVPGTGRDAALLELRRWRRLWEASAAESLPVMAELFSWLERNAPPAPARVSVVWGDVGVGNFIYRGDDIVALTDFEQAHLGDPMKDIAAAIWRGIDGVIPLDEFFEVYERRSGIPIDHASVAYYSVFIDAQYSATSGSVLRLFTGERPPDVTFARMGLGIMYQCLDRGMKAVAGTRAPVAL